jgi:hypothetical protein
VCLGIKQPSGAYDQIFISVRQLRVCWCGVLSLTRGRVCRLQLLPGLARAVNFGSGYHGSSDYILLPQIRDFPSRRLLRLAGLRWRYSTPPPHGSRRRLTYTLISSRHGPCTENTATPLLRAYLLGFSRDRFPLLSDVITRVAQQRSRGGQRKHFHRTVAWRVCWNVFTEPPPSNVLSKPVTILWGPLLLLVIDVR